MPAEIAQRFRRCKQMVKDLRQLEPKAGRDRWHAVRYLWPPNPD
jgi:hypothetical protein